MAHPGIVQALRCTDAQGAPRSASRFRRLAPQLAEQQRLLYLHVLYKAQKTVFQGKLLSSTVDPISPTNRPSGWRASGILLGLADTEAC